MNAYQGNYYGGYEAFRPVIPTPVPAGPPVAPAIVNAPSAPIVNRPGAVQGPIVGPAPGNGIPTSGQSIPPPGSNGGPPGSVPGPNGIPRGGFPFILPIPVPGPNAPGSSPVPPPIPHPSSSGAGLARETIIMIVVLCVLLVMILATIAAFIYINKKKQETAASNDDQGLPKFSSKAQIESGRVVAGNLPSLPMTAVAGTALAAGASQSQEDLPGISHVSFEDTNAIYANAAQHQGIHLANSTAIPVTNIAEASASKDFDDPFYEVDSDNENLYVDDNQLYVLPPMTRQVEKNGIVSTEVVHPQDLQEISHTKTVITENLENTGIDGQTTRSAKVTEIVSNPSSSLGNLSDYDTAIMVTETTTVVHNNDVAEESLQGLS